MKQEHSNSSEHLANAGLPTAGQYEIDIRGYLDALMEGKISIFLIWLLAVIAAAAYLFVAAPVYSSNVLIQFLDKDNRSGALGEVSAVLVTQNSAAAAEVQIIKSRRILSATIEQLNLDVTIKPGHPLRDGIIVIDSLDVGPELIGKKLSLKVTGNGKYQLSGPNGAMLLTGQEGELAVGSTPGKLSMRLVTLNAESGTEFSVKIKPLDRSLLELSKKLAIKEEGKSSDIFSMSLEGKDPRLITATLNTIVENYLAYTADKKSEEIQVMIDFVRQELQAVQRRLEQAETAQVEFLFSRNSTGLSSEVTKLVDRLANIKTQITELEIKKVGSESKYTPNHPVIRDLTRKIELLESEERDIDQRLKLLPEEEREREALLREVEATKQIYIHLQSKEQELGVALSGIANSVRVIDYAQTPVTPIKPQRWVVLAQATFAGLFLGLFFVIGRRAMRLRANYQ